MPICIGSGLYVCDQEMFVDTVTISGRTITLAPKRCTHCRRLAVARTMAEQSS